MKKATLALVASFAMVAAMIGQTTDTGNIKGMSLRSVYSTSYDQAERSLQTICKTSFNNDWNSVELNTPQVQDEINKFVSQELGKMPGVDQAQIRQQIEAAFSAALFQLKHTTATASH